jgi:hypothetical protein
MDRRGSLVGILFPVGGKSKPCMHFDLSKDELGLIGFATVHWAYLEHRLLMATIEIADELKLVVPKNATQNGFNKRLAAFREIVGGIPEEKERDRFLKIASQVSKENGFRQKLIHGIWSYDRTNPEVLHVEVSRSNNPPKAFFRADVIRRFCVRVGELSFQLTYPEGYTSERLAMDRDDQAYFSRSFLQSIFGTTAQKSD